MFIVNKCSESPIFTSAQRQSHTWPNETVHIHKPRKTRHLRGIRARFRRRGSIQKKRKIKKVFELRSYPLTGPPFLIHCTCLFRSFIRNPKKTSLTQPFRPRSREKGVQSSERERERSERERVPEREIGARERRERAPNLSSIPAVN